jgi:hypothetical protein
MWMMAEKKEKKQQRASSTETRWVRARGLQA